MRGVGVEHSSNQAIPYPVNGLSNYANDVLAFI